jgi:hypothetical protein
MKIEILDFFLFLWVIFALLDPDPATQIKADPKPKPWFVDTYSMYLMVPIPVYDKNAFA